MGHRANLVIVGPQGFELYYSHWCANGLPRDLFWGPDHAEAFIRMQRRVANDDWLDTGWAEGGAVLDRDKRTLLLFGGEDVLWNVPSRRLYLRLLSTVWEGWRVSWAYEGIVELAEYVGLPRTTVTLDSEEDHRMSLAPGEERSWVSCVGSFRIEGALRFYPLDGIPEWYVRSGPALLNDCGRHPWCPTMKLAEWTDEFPGGGFHIDDSRRTVDFWIASVCPNIEREARGKWPGWTVTWHRDRYEVQSELTGGALTFNEPSPEVLLKDLSQMLMLESKPVDVMDMIRCLPGAEGSDIKVDSYALRDDRLSIDSQERSRILATALGRIADAE